MTSHVVFRAEASRDAEEARDYFDAERAGLGQVFIDRLGEDGSRFQGQDKISDISCQISVPATGMG